MMKIPPKSERINVHAALNILSASGPISLSLKGFEARVEQLAMMRNVLEAYHYNHIALIEAGTGTGKSLAYLIPSMLWSAETKERTVISTNTITLQEQLLEKDIPLINKALNLNLKAVLVKGMHNYLCIRKSEEIQHELLLLSPTEIEEIQKIDAWKHSTQDGSRASLSFTPSHSTWEKVAAESDSCNRNQCPYYQECHFFKARKQAHEAQILIVNHHLLFADLVCREENQNYQDAAILPQYDRVIIDEAHNIEEIATDYFASKVSYIDLIRLTARLAAEKKGKALGKLMLLKEKLYAHYKNELSHEVKSIFNRLSTDIPGLRRDLLQQATETFEAFLEFTQSVQQGRGDSQDETLRGEKKLRVLKYHYGHPLWKEKLTPNSKGLSESIKKYVHSLTALITDIKQLKNSQLDEQIKSITFEINTLSTRLNDFSESLDNFINSTIPPSKVRWIEQQTFKTMVNTTLINADLDVSKTLASHLFNKFSTIILCSATLTSNNNFEFIRNRLGLNDEKLNQKSIKESIYNSPFDFKKQVLFVVPTDMPSQHEQSFTDSLIENIWQALLASRGNAFILFTSYTLLNICYNKLESKIKEMRFNPLKQGDDDRNILLNKFKTIDHSILFGTDSFWEGIDVAGEALRLVIIVKLPFKVPSDPLIQARSEAITEKGGDPFADYSLPQAIVKFKQGFGRLIRNKNDRGCVVCLDNRIVNKSYGKLFLNSLPNCQQLFTSTKDLSLEMKDFYRRTHFLTKK